MLSISLNSPEKKRIAINLGLLLLLQFVSYLSPLLVLPRLTRVLTVQEFGLYSVSLAVIGIALVFTDFGFNLSGPNYVAMNLQSKKKIARFLGSVIVLKTILFLIVSSFLLALFFLGIFDAAFSIELLVLLVCIIAFQSIQLNWFFQGIERLKRVTTYSMFTKLLYIVFVFIFVNEKSTIGMVLLLYLISQVASSVLGIFSIYAEGYLILKPDWPDIKYVFERSLFFFLSRILVSIYTTASTLLVGFYAGLSQAAFYSSAEKLYQGAQTLTAPISQVLYPYLSRTGNRRALSVIFSIIMLPLLLGSIIVWINAEFIVCTFYGDNFLEAAKVFKIFIIIFNITFISIIMGYPAYSSINRLDIANKSVIWGGMVQLIILIAIIKLKKVNGINIATGVLVAEVFVMIYRVVLFIKLTNPIQVKKNT